MSRRNVPLVLAIAIDTLGAGIFAPLSLLYFVRVADLSLLAVGALATAGAVVSLPVPLLAGHLADRFSPRNVVIAGQLIQAAGFLGYLVARDVVAIFVVIGIVAVGQRMFWSSFFALPCWIHCGAPEAFHEHTNTSKLGCSVPGSIALTKLPASNTPLPLNSPVAITLPSSETVTALARSL